MFRLDTPTFWTSLVLTRPGAPVMASGGFEVRSSRRCVARRWAGRYSGQIAVFGQEGGWRFTCEGAHGAASGLKFPPLVGERREHFIACRLRVAPLELVAIDVVMCLI